MKGFLTKETFIRHNSRGGPVGVQDVAYASCKAVRKTQPLSFIPYFTKK